MPMNDILGIIEATVRERFGPLISSVKVTREIDSDGDGIFKVTVVFDGDAPLDAHKTSGIVRHTRHKLMARDEHSFPIFAFVSKADAGAEAA
jgi:hypothetical protein